MKKKKLATTKSNSHSIKTHHKSIRTPKKTKGAINAGFLYVILLILIIMAAASTLIGDISPKPHAPDPQTRQPAIIISGVLEDEKSNLQLYTLPAITIAAPPSAIPSYPNDDTSSFKNKRSDGDDFKSNRNSGDDEGNNEPGGSSPNEGENSDGDSEENQGGNDSSGNDSGSQNAR